MDRRTFLQSINVALLSGMLPRGAEAATPVPLSEPSANSPAGGEPSQRSVLNIGFAAGANDYRFIDHFLAAEQFGPVGRAWSAGQIWLQSIGSDGYPNRSIKVSENRPFGGGIRIPASFHYGEPGSNQYYILRWKGNGEVKLPLHSGSWTYIARRSTNATQAGSDRWRTTLGSDTYIVLSFSGPAQLFSIIVYATDPHNTGALLHNLQFYRLEDEADLQAGRIFRTAYKQAIVDLCPSAIRFMDWVGGNNCRQTTFSSRTLPSYAAWGGAGGGGNSNWAVSLPYGETAGINQYSLAPVDGMPSRPTQGEIVTCRIGSGMARSGSKNVITITNSNPGRVSALAHGFATGDVIAHQLAAGVMPELNLSPCTITVIDENSYSIGVDTTAFGPFRGSAKANQFITLNVGGRGAYPVTFPIPTAPASTFGNAYIAAGDYKTFVFDKTISAQTDGHGNHVFGVWMFNDAGSNNGHNGDVPIEICTALINELNAMHPSHPIHMWMNIPHMGLCSMDPDYTVEESWGIQAVNVVLNGAHGFPGLAKSARLFIEFSNETWNSAGSGFSQTFYCAYRGFLRWPSAGVSDYASMVALRSVINVEDIKGSAHNSERLSFVLAGQGTLGVSGLNLARIDGTKFYHSDPSNVWGPTVAPMAHHDYFAFAGYFVPSKSFDSAYLAKQVADWLANIHDLDGQEIACAGYVKGIVDQTLGGSETVDRYRLTLLPAYVAKMKSYNRIAIMYEGGWDRSVTVVSAGGSVSGALPFAGGAIDGKSNLVVGVSASYLAALAPGYFILGYGIPPLTRIVSLSGTTIVLSNNTTVKLSFAQFVAFAPEQMFLFAVKRSQSWSTALLTFFNQFGSGSAMPAEYIANGLRWGHIFPTSYGFENTEWDDVDVLWQKAGERNRSLG